jgi:ABC-type multidrug transport system fused ATPase/permease subunit
LDPFGQCNDEQIRDALSRANLDDFVHSLSGQLDFVVTEGGANVSQGQRQQIALARAILRRPKIFLMDEGTSAVDTKTDTLIQSSIRQCFADGMFRLVGALS